MDTATFLKRALVFQAELQRKSYPNASSLAESCECSRSTAMRTIDRLRYEFGVPIDYDESRRGYFLTVPDFSFVSLPPGRDELVALILSSELLSMIEDQSLQGAMSALWTRITNGRSDLNCDLEQIRGRFSSDSTSVAKLADVDLVRLIGLCHRGQPVALTYRSPWRHEEDKEYQGIFLRLHLSDGILYAMFEDQRGRQIVMNASFMRNIRAIEQVDTIHDSSSEAASPRPYWLEGFGVWSGAKPETIEIRIGAPASRYYVAQTWHPDQDDVWEGDVLVRRFPGIPSPELNRRILSLGRFVLSVKPESILEQLRVDVAHLHSLCREI
ncbi:MAG: helix-turn-helix transcriptional regulator [Pseudomonadota bacterium]